MVVLTLLEEGRNAYLSRVLGEGFGVDEYVVAHVEVDYRVEIPSGTQFVESRQRVVALGNSSVTFEEELWTPSGVIAAAGRVVIVMWVPQRHRSRPLTTLERQAIACEMALV